LLPVHHAHVVLRRTVVRRRLLIIIHTGVHRHDVIIIIWSTYVSTSYLGSLCERAEPLLLIFDGFNDDVATAFFSDELLDSDVTVTAALSHYYHDSSSDISLSYYDVLPPSHKLGNAGQRRWVILLTPG
jgi:hypothetical protein